MPKKKLNIVDGDLFRTSVLLTQSDRSIIIKEKLNISKILREVIRERYDNPEYLLDKKITIQRELSRINQAIGDFDIKNKQREDQEKTLQQREKLEKERGRCPICNEILPKKPAIFKGKNFCPHHTIDEIQYLLQGEKIK